jgi:hypothetical protein
MRKFAHQIHIPNGLEILQTVKNTKLAIKYTNIFRSKAIRRYRNRDFWYANVPSGNPVPDRKLTSHYIKMILGECWGGKCGTTYPPNKHYFFFNLKGLTKKVPLT